MNFVVVKADIILLNNQSLGGAVKLFHFSYY